MNNFIKNFESIINQPIYSILVILNIVFIEGILSIDNAAVLATMITNMNKHDRKKAFKYGIIGAYIFRGLSLIFTTFLLKIKWLKLIGGLYLLFIGIKFFLIKKINIKKKISYKLFDNLWIKILYIELIDLSFSIDNIIAANAISNNLLLIFLGVFIGILTMRFITNIFLILIQKYPNIQNYAFLIIIILGIKMIISYYKFYDNRLYFIFEKIFTDNIISIVIIILFFIPIFFKLLKNILKLLKNIS